MTQLDDGFGSVWEMCDRVNCGLQTVRPGKVQCWCDSAGGPFHLADATPGNTDVPMSDTYGHDDA